MVSRVLSVFRGPRIWPATVLIISQDLHLVLRGTREEVAAESIPVLLQGSAGGGWLLHLICKPAYSEEATEKGPKPRGNNVCPYVAASSAP